MDIIFVALKHKKGQKKRNSYGTILFIKKARKRFCCVLIKWNTQAQVAIAYYGSENFEVWH
jgi:hypothetical protein